MKYNVIIVEQKKVVVDKSADIINYDDEPYLLITDDYETYIHKHKGDIRPTTKHFEIIATINHSISLDIPMIIIEDEVEKLAEHSSEVQEATYTPQHKITYKHGFIDGFNALQQKGVYSEEDMIRCYDGLLQNVGTCVKQSELPTSKEYIQSLKQEYIELEMEEKQHYEKDKTKRINPLNGVFYKTRIKTNRINGQLITYIKKL